MQAEGPVRDATGAASVGGREEDEDDVGAPIAEAVKKIPLLTVNAGPRDGEEWSKRLKEEYKALIGAPTGATVGAHSPRWQRAWAACVHTDERR